MGKYPDRICPICEKPFAVKWVNQVCCCPEHQRKWKSVMERKRRGSIRALRVEIASLRLNAMTDGRLEKSETALAQALEASQHWEAAYHHVEATHIQALDDAARYKQERNSALALVDKLSKHIEDRDKLISIYETKLAEQHDERLRRDREQEARDAAIQAHLKNAKYCARMKLAAKTLPCGDRRVCYFPPCDSIPKGKTMPVQAKGRDGVLQWNTDII